MHKNWDGVMIVLVGHHTTTSVNTVAEGWIDKGL